MEFMSSAKNEISAVDLFCGIGGLSFGLIQSGIKVTAGIDIDDTCRFAFEENCNALFVCKRVEELTKTNLLELFGNSKYKVLAGCAPCQPFSNYMSSFLFQPLHRRTAHRTDE
jgi:DNA (cytosine-5)-methyltransferase 1